MIKQLKIVLVAPLALGGGMVGPNYQRPKSETPSQFAGSSEVLEFLATLPSPQETLALRPSPKLQARMTKLLEKNRTTGLSPEEREEIQHYEYAEQLVRMAKGRALVKLKGR